MSNLGARGGVLVTRTNKRPVMGRKRSGASQLKPATDQTKRVRLDDPAQRREVVLTAALKVARAESILDLTWPKVAVACEVKTSVITARRTFQSLVALRRAVAERGKSTGDQKLMDEAARFGLLN